MAVLFVYDVTREKTLFDMNKWFKIIKKVCDIFLFSMNYLKTI